MSHNQEPETLGTPAPEVNAQKAPEPSAAEPQANSAAADFRKGICTETQVELLMALGEEPQDYRRMMESLLEDLEPRAGLESQLVEQMGETFWRMRRVQRMRDGLALKSIENWLGVETMTAGKQAAQVVELLEPFEQLEQALSPRGEGPTAAEIDEFVRAHKGEASERMREFLVLLESLKAPMEKRQRRYVRRKARNQLVALMDPLEKLAWRYSRRYEKVNSPESLAAMMATDDPRGVLLQKMEDSHLRRLWRLTNTLAKVRQGALHKKDVKNDRTKPECV
jgi:cell division protein FtsB